MYEKRLVRCVKEIIANGGKIHGVVSEGAFENEQEIHDALKKIKGVHLSETAAEVVASVKKQL